MTPIPAGMDPQTADAMRRVVVAGTRLMYDPKVFPAFKQALEAQAPLPDKLAAQAAGLMKILMDRSGGKLPKKVVIPAGVALLLEMAHFMAQSGLAKPTEQDLKAATKKLIALLVRIFGGPSGAPAAPGAPPTAPPPGAPMPPPTPPPGIIAGAQPGA